MEGMGLKFTPMTGDVSYAIQACLGLWLALLGLTASPNSPNGGFNLPPVPPTLLPSHLPSPYNVPSVILQWFRKSCSKSSSVSRDAPILPEFFLE